MVPCKSHSKNNFKRGFRQPRNKHAIAIQSIDRIEVANTKGLITVYVSMKPISSLFDVYAPTSGAHSDNTVIGDLDPVDTADTYVILYILV